MDDMGLVLGPAEENLANHIQKEITLCWGHKFLSIFCTVKMCETIQNHLHLQFLQPKIAITGCRQFTFIDIFVNMQSVWILLLAWGGGEGRGQDQAMKIHTKSHPNLVEISLENLAQPFQVKSCFCAKYGGLEFPNAISPVILELRISPAPTNGKIPAIGSHTQSTESKLKSSHTGILNGNPAFFPCFFFDGRQNWDLNCPSIFTAHPTLPVHDS